MGCSFSIVLIGGGGLILFIQFLFVKTMEKVITLGRFFLPNSFEDMGISDIRFETSEATISKRG